MTDLIVVEPQQVPTVFVPGGLDPYIQHVKDQVEGLVFDVSTSKGRKEIASAAAKVAKAKTYLDGIGKEYVASLKKQPKIVDAERKRMRDALDALKNEVRAPLDEVEEQERLHIQAIHASISELGMFEQAKGDIEELKKCLEDLEGLYAETDFESEHEFAKQRYTSAKNALKVRIMEAEKEEEDRRRLIKEQAERARAEQEAREKKIAEDAAREAIEAEERARMEARHAAAKAVSDAEEAARKAVKEAEEKAETARAEAELEALKREREAEAVRIAADLERLEKEEEILRLKDEAEQAAAEERRMIADEKEREEADREAAEADEKNRMRVFSEMRLDLEDIVFPEIAEQIVEAIMLGQIRNVSIDFGVA